jgi:hypothetical protein
MCIWLAAAALCCGAVVDSQRWISQHHLRAQLDASKIMLLRPTGSDNDEILINNFTAIFVFCAHFAHVKTLYSYTSKIETNQPTEQQTTQPAADRARTKNK